MNETLTEYKYKKISTESFKNGLRLHFDSIVLFENGSYPSAYQLSVLSLEEFSKSNWVEHCYWSCTTSGSFPDKKIEQDWLKLLYLHPKKQEAFFGWGMMFDYSPKFIDFVERKGLEYKKQVATYVGLVKNKDSVNVNSRISLPSRVGRNDSKQMISLINAYLKEICMIKNLQDFYFDIEEKNDLITDELIKKLNKWRFKSGLKSEKWYNEWMKKIDNKKKSSS